MEKAMADKAREWSRAYRKGSQWVTKDQCMRVLRREAMTVRWRVLTNIARVVGTHGG